ncbi:hypothetical protein [Microvirga rosea]|uniref:hypothetical protein n=1 Tax=Microvirga rosea TaxID=2715425 RepID=UPI001D0AFB25|nr:hypothetical protein [Microvirga rosea]
MDLPAALGIAVSLLIAGPCVAECPKVAEAGVTLTSADKHTQFKISQANERLVTIQRIEDGVLTSSTVYHEGLFPLLTRHLNGPTTFEYTTPYQQFRLKVGEEIRFAYVMRTPDHKETRLVSKMRVSGTDEVEIGGCRYSVFVLEKLNLTSGKGANSSIVLAYFSEALRLPLRSRIRFNDGRQQDFIFSSITLQ